ncbi:MAG: hypothetical protein LBT46_00260 [Planctomycetaceae bacterium]|jgi:hypothetical protein|nr:hypothetical protein [Planctomycetaceae bacterium]
MSKPKKVLSVISNGCAKSAVPTVFSISVMRFIRRITVFRLAAGYGKGKNIRYKRIAVGSKGTLAAVNIDTKKTVVNFTDW